MTGVKLDIPDMNRTAPKGYHFCIVVFVYRLVNKVDHFSHSRTR